MNKSRSSIPRPEWRDEFRVLVGEGQDGDLINLAWQCWKRLTPAQRRRVECAVKTGTRSRFVSGIVGSLSRRS